MKLNLLPTSASKGRNTGRAWFLSSVIAIGSIAGAVWMIVTSQADLEKAKNAALEEKPKAEQVVEIAKKADTLIALSKPSQINNTLVDAIDKHVAVYPDFYNKIRQAIPGFFRVSQLVGVPVSANQVNLTISGIIKDQDSYNNLVLALLRMPGAANIQRQAIPYDPVIVPNLLPNDLDPKPYKQSEGRAPSDAIDKLNFYIGKGGVTGFENAGGFGADEPGVRGAMPGSNLVTITMQVEGALQVPDVRGALASHGPAPAPVAPAAAGAPAATAAAATQKPAAPGAAPGDLTG